jgi:hypothetical protein
MWMVMKEVGFRRRYYADPDQFGSHVAPPLYYDDIFLSALLCVASLALLHKGLWSSRVALLLSGLVLFDALFRDFWFLAKNAEVPRFSYEHFTLWWPNLGEGQFLQIILSGAILCCAVAHLVPFMRSRKSI